MQDPASTNVIESAFSIVERVCSVVKQWHGGDQRERWVGAGLLAAEKPFRRVQGYKQVAVLLIELRTFVPPKSGVVKRRKASQSGSRENRYFERTVGHPRNGLNWISRS
jgi:hypothetical protein